MARNSTNADWWSNQGVVRSKAVLTFADNTTVEVYGTDYIKSWKLAQDLAKLVINRTFDRSNGALFFHNKNISPYWSKDKLFY